MNGCWKWPGAARKAHFFQEGLTISICGKWLYNGECEKYQGSSHEDDCKVCSRKLDKANGTS